MIAWRERKTGSRQPRHCPISGTVFLRMARTPRLVTAPAVLYSIIQLTYLTDMFSNAHDMIISGSHFIIQHGSREQFVSWRIHQTANFHPTYYPYLSGQNLTTSQRHSDSFILLSRPFFWSAANHTIVALLYGLVYMYLFRIDWRPRSGLLTVLLAIAMAVTQPQLNVACSEKFWIYLWIIYIELCGQSPKFPGISVPVTVSPALIFWYLIFSPGNFGSLSFFFVRSAFVSESRIIYKSLDSFDVLPASTLQSQTLIFCRICTIPKPLFSLRSQLQKKGTFYSEHSMA